MAVFDVLERSKMMIDDTQPLSCTLEAAENVQGHTVYVMRVHREPSEVSWQVTRRYSDFDALNNALLYSGIDLPLPPKKVFGKLEREFVAERQQGLQAYINFVLSHLLLSSSIHVKRFLDPSNYSFNFVETSLQHVSMIFRSEPQWEVVEPLLDFGWRIRKQYFSIKNKNEPKKRFVLSWMAMGPDIHLNEKDLSSAVKLLGNVQHPFMYPLSMSSVSANGGLVIYDFLENGSLKDFLCKTKPRVHYLKKYGNPKSYATLEPQKIRTYGGQILLALKFLHDRGFYHGSLQSGNVAIVDGKCKVLDIFNGILGVSSYLRPYFTKIKKIQTVENIDIYCFGHLLYEMALGIPLSSPTCDILPQNCPSELRSVIEAILSKDALKKGIPTIADLLQHPFFMHSSNDIEKVHFKVPSQLKESLKKSRELTEQRLKEEQKSIRHSKRLSKVHAQLTSEEEKKKRSKERKNRSNLDLVNSTSSERSQASTPTGTVNDLVSPTSSMPSLQPISPPSAVTVNSENVTVKNNATVSVPSTSSIPPPAPPAPPPPPPLS
ncbi:PX domain-containing protein kinase-like protein, partial [Stegodyphus mimosarum]